MTDRSTAQRDESDVTTHLVRQLRQLRVVPVLVLENPVTAGHVARAFVEGGLPCVEVTFRTAGAAEALRRITAEHPDVIVGAGTVLTPTQAGEAQAAGARFVVAPGLNPRVVGYCRDHDLPVFPGVCTPTDIEGALDLGLHVLKFFPAEQMGGVPFLEAIAAPYAGIEFIPTGGIDLETLPRYLRSSRVLACGGSWMAPKAWVAAGAYDRIREAARLAVQAASAARAQA